MQFGWNRRPSDGKARLQTAGVNEGFWKRFVYFSILIAGLAPSSGASCQPAPGMRWRADGRCGVNFPIVGGVAAECDPENDRPCCSDFGYCGNSVSHCRCTDCVDFRSVYRDPDCLFTLKQLSGHIQSPGYPNPYPVAKDCCYDISRPSNSFCGVRFVVEELDLGRPEEMDYCQRDWLSFPSCVPEKGTRICGNRTGQVFQYLFQPGATAMRMVFHSGPLREGRTGFKLKYELLQTCSGPYQDQNLPISLIPGTGKATCYTRITDLRGTINTPYYPKPYPDDLDCVYEFVRFSPQICGIRMQSIAFEMEHPLDTIFGGACKDFLHSPSCGFVCGKVNFSWIVEFQPGAQSIRFHFHSDEDSHFPGFLINFEQIIKCP